MSTTYTDLLATTRKTTRELSLADLKKRIDAGEKMTLVDVREKEEYRAGYIPGALSLPRGFLEMQAEQKLPDKNAKIVVYCAGGTRSAFAAKALTELGYSNVETANPGYTRWKDSGFPVELPPQLTDSQRDRYSRHIMLPEVGEAGQEKLLKSKILLLGAGGLGSPSGLYLAAAGVGTLGFVDADVVDASNLQRQIIHATSRVGMPKVESAAKAIKDLNPDTKVIGIEDLRTAIAYSSDVYFYTVGGGYQGKKGLGIDRLNYWYETFGLTKPTGIELPGEQSGFVPTPDWKQKTFGEAWNIGDTYHTAIGQYSMQLTPIEEARAIAAIANGGKLLTPTLLKTSGAVGGETLAVSPANLEVVREGMRKGVTEGTSVGLNDLSFVDPAGKTGTAQLGLHNEFYNAWAVGFWPYNDPKYVYVVVMEKGPAGNSTGGIYVMHRFLSALHAAAPEYFK